MSNKKRLKKTFPDRDDFPQRIIGALADSFGKSVATINRWIDNHDHRLTSDLAKMVYAKEGFKWNPDWVLVGTASVAA